MPPLDHGGVLGVDVVYHLPRQKEDESTRRVGETISWSNLFVVCVGAGTVVSIWNTVSLDALQGLLTKTWPFEGPVPSSLATKLISSSPQTPPSRSTLLKSL